MRWNVLMVLLCVIGAFTVVSIGGCGGEGGKEELEQLVVIGPNSPEREPAPQEVIDYVLEQAEGRSGFDIQLTHHLSTIEIGDTKYAHYVVLATYEEEEEMYEHGVLGLYLSGSRAGTIEYKPRTNRISVQSSPVRTVNWPAQVKYTPSGMYRYTVGWVVDPDTASFTLNFQQGQVTVEDAQEFPYFVMLMYEYHRFREGAVQGIKGLEIDSPPVIAYDSEGNVIE